jgi:hypothetical protein
MLSPKPCELRDHSTDEDSAALPEYVARHDPDEVTGALERFVEALGGAETPDDFVRAGARRSPLAARPRPSSGVTCSTSDSASSSWTPTRP